MAEYAAGGSVQVCMMQICTLEGDGVPLPGSQHYFVTDGLAKLEMTPVYTKGADIEMINGCGAPNVLYKDMDRFKRWDLTMSINYLDPELEYMLIAGADGLYTSTVPVANTSVGTSTPAVAAYSGYQYGVGIELWSKHIVNGDQDATYPWVRWVIPRSKWGFDKITFDNAAMSRDFMGFTSANPNYYHGPNADWPYASDTQLMYAYSKTIPTAVVGAQTLGLS